MSRYTKTILGKFRVTKKSVPKEYNWKVKSGRWWHYFKSKEKATKFKKEVNGILRKR